MADNPNVQQLNFNPLMAFMGDSINALGQLKTGMDAVRYSKYNQGLSEAEAKIEQDRATYNSWIIRTRAEIEETQHVEEGRRIEGRLRAKAGASGAALGSGSVLQNLANTHAELEKDRLLIRFNADLEDKSQRYASEARAAGIRNQAASEVFSSRLARSNAVMQAGSTLLTANVKYNESLYKQKATAAPSSPPSIVTPGPSGKVIVPRAEVKGSPRVMSPTQLKKQVN